jgi:hypothetical protein
VINDNEIGDQQPDLTSSRNTSTAAAHPEEMKATIDLRVGNLISFSGTARATPAGLTAVALILSAILIPMVFLMRNRRR